MTAPAPWLPIKFYPNDDAERLLLLPDCRQVIGARKLTLLGGADGWAIHTRHDYEEPVYENPLRGGLITNLRKRGAVEPERKQIGVRKAVMWIVSDLPQDMTPTHYRPNDTNLGHPKGDPR